MSQNTLPEQKKLQTISTWCCSIEICFSTAFHTSNRTVQICWTCAKNVYEPDRIGKRQSICRLEHVTLKSWLTWKAFSCSPWQTELGRAIFFSFWLELETRNGVKEISKFLKIKQKTGSICLQVVTFLKRKIKCLISRVDSQVTSLFMQ